MSHANSVIGSRARASGFARWVEFHRIDVRDDRLLGPRRRVRDGFEPHGKFVRRGDDRCRGEVDGCALLVVANDVGEFGRREGQAGLVEEAEAAFDFDGPVLARKRIGWRIGVARPAEGVNLLLDIGRQRFHRGRFRRGRLGGRPQPPPMAAQKRIAAIGIIRPDAGATELIVLPPVADAALNARLESLYRTAPRALRPVSTRRIPGAVQLERIPELGGRGSRVAAARGRELRQSLASRPAQSPAFAFAPRWRQL